MALPVLKGPFTVAVYERMPALGVLPADARTELINGQVVAMTPIGPPHGSCVNRLNALFAPLLGHEATVGVQNPIVLGERHEPQPDVALLRYRPDGYRSKHPGPRDVFLLIEVADTTLAYDSGVKLPLYARAGVPETWIVDLTADRLIVYRQPAGERYGSSTILARGETIAPLGFPALSLPVTDILG